MIESVVIEIKNIKAREWPWAVQVGRELHGARTFTESLRFGSRGSAAVVASFLAQQFVQDGRRVIVVGRNGRERVIDGS